jgi:hypothetical protein
MTHKNKQKGNRVERRLVNAAKSKGIPAERAYASNGRSLGMEDEVDLLVGGYRLQSKSRKKFPQWLIDANLNVDGVVLVQNHVKPKILIDYDLFLGLIESNYEEFLKENAKSDK